MSQRPVPAAVYWRRRLLVLAVLLLLVWLTLRAVNSQADEPAPKPAATPTPSATTAAVPTTGTFEVALTANDRACDPEKVRITPTVPSGQQTRGEVEIGLLVSSTETTACTLQPDDAELIAIISANDTPVWDSTLCKASLLTEPVQLSPGWSPLVTTAWSGRGSGSGCSSSAAWAGAGTYTLQVGTLGGEPGEVEFKLVGRPEATPKPTPSKSTPSASPSPDDE